MQSCFIQASVDTFRRLFVGLVSHLCCIALLKERPIRRAGVLTIGLVILLRSQSNSNVVLTPVRR